MLGRVCVRRGRVRVEMLARDEARAAYSRLLETHCETWRLTDWLVDGRGCIGSAQGGTMERGCS